MGMSQAGCCCNPCTGNHDICCLKCTVNGGFFDGLQFYALKRSSIIIAGEDDTFVFTPGEPCNGDSGRCNNLSGRLVGPYHNTNTRVTDPFTRYISCDPLSFYDSRGYDITWSPDSGDDCTVTMKVTMGGWECSADNTAGYPVDTYLGHAWSHKFKKTGMPANWYTTSRTLEDSRVPGSGVTLTVEACPSEFDLLPVENRPVRFRVFIRTTGNGNQSSCEQLSWSDWQGCLDLEGDLLCGTRACSEAPVTFGAGWSYGAKDTISIRIPYTNSIMCPDGSYVAGPWDQSNYDLCIPFDDGNWPDVVPQEFPPETIPSIHPACSGECFEYFQVKIEEIPIDSECEDCFGVDPPPPPPEDGHCRTYSPCVDLVAPVVVDGDEYGYKTTCRLTWTELTDTTGEYTGDCAAPDEFLSPLGNPVVVTFWMYQDESRRPSGAPLDSDTYVLVITIKDSVTDAVLETREYVLSLLCTTNWSFYDSFDLSSLFDPEYTGPTELEVRVGVNCSTETVTPPPECDPGCWPECVMCPERKTLYAVVSDAPDCCLSGSYALTWVGTGGGGAPTVGYYELSAPVGGPIDTCGQITFLRVYCVDSTHITVQLVYLRAEGTEISNLSSPDTLSVICDESGNLESDAINVPGRSGGRESLCGFGSGVGGDIRIVST